MPRKHAADGDDVAIELARRLADDDVQLGAAAGVGPVVAAHADRAVTMRHPHLAGGLRSTPDREAVDPAGLGRVAVGDPVV